MTRRSTIILVLCLVPLLGPLFGQSTTRVPPNLNLRKQAASTNPSASKVPGPTQQKDTIDVRSFGAVGDGVTDDTAAFRAAIAAAMALGHGGTVYVPQGRYRITDTIEMRAPRGLRLVGQLGTYNYSTVEAGDTRIFFDGNPQKPLLYIERGQGIQFADLVLDGQKIYEEPNQACALMWFDGLHADVVIRHCWFRNARLGIRVCSSYDDVNDRWHAGLNRYTGVLDPAAEAAGGYQSDNYHIENCVFSYCDKGGISIESAQSLDDQITKCQFQACEVGIRLAACQGVVIDSPTFLGITETGIKALFRASSGGFVIRGSHCETGAGSLFKSTAPSCILGSTISFENCTGGDISITGCHDDMPGQIAIRSSHIGDVNIVSPNVSLAVYQSQLISLSKPNRVSYGDRLTLHDVTVTGPVSDNAFCYYIKDFKNVTFSHKISGNTLWANMTRTPRYGTSGYQPDLVLGDVAANSTSHGMDGVTFKGGNNLLIGDGCYLDAAGAWVATRTSGAKLALGVNGYTVETFTRARVGGAPMFVERFHAGGDYGVYLPRATADMSPTPGTMYYNTATGKVRIRDGAGWRDF